LDDLHSMLLQWGGLLLTICTLDIWNCYAVSWIYRLMEGNKDLTEESARVLCVRGTAPVENGTEYWLHILEFVNFVCMWYILETFGF